ncbi:MAG: hypothetical protein QF743_03205, partial [Candidatus Marinimicrobia bacterium]|nr:hypothetical protein [Candidatus Neomarinimicrobiota bacterium]
MRKIFFYIISSFLILFGQESHSNDSMDIEPPKLDESIINIDGSLDEIEWSKAISRSGFTSYLPVDGRPAEDDTEIRIWYSPTALYIGIVAQEIHGEVRSTLADRDNLENDDYLILILDTYDDKRSAF